MEVVLEQETESGSLQSSDDSNIFITLAITHDQEVAIRTFFQVNDWPLIEGEKPIESKDNNTGTQLMTLRVTPEQEAAMEAFFQINNWALIKEADKDLTVVTEILENTETVIQEGISETVISSATPLEEITEIAGGTGDVSHIQVSSTGSDGQQQVIVYKDGQAQLLPGIILEDGSRSLGSQIIVQEISFPEARNLEQSIIINPKPITKRVTPRGTVKPGDKLHKCHVCGKTFKQSPSFNGHYQSHFGNKPHTCDICGTGFTLKAALVAHQSIHTGEKPYQCTVCLKRFRRKDDLLSHIRTHTGEKPYECEICGKKFKYRNQIPKHKRSHTGDRPYKCSYCEKAFTSNIHLKRHERTHTGERPYKCEYCSKAFTQYGHLQAHIRIHTNERPYKCSVCGRGFREKKVLKKHESLHTMERPYKCDVCGKGFLRQSNMELHSVMHQKERQGVPRPRPRPKKKKQAADAEMREFVENVLSTVVKVETGMQTETIVEENKAENTVAVDNLAAFVDFAVGTQELQQHGVDNSAGVYQDPNVKIDTIPDNLGNQYTLVLPEDGGQGYLLAVDQAQEQIVSSGPDIQTLPTAEELNQQVVNATQGYNASSTVEDGIVGSNLITEATNVLHNVLEHPGHVGNTTPAIIEQNMTIKLETDTGQDTDTTKNQDIGENREFSTLDFSALNSDVSSSAVANQMDSTEQENSSAQLLSDSGQIHIVK